MTTKTEGLFGLKKVTLGHTIPIKSEFNSKKEQMNQVRLYERNSRLAFLVVVLMVFSGFSVSPAAAFTTAPTPDTPGSNTTVTINSSPIREGVTISGNATLGVGTSALLNPGLADRVIQTTYDSNTIYQSGTAQAPEGWTLEYSTNSGSSWSTTEPSPASSVTDIRARKTSVAAGAIDGYSQEYSTETVANIPSNTFAASSGGDGWGVAFYDDYVFNIYHHSGQTTLSCKLKSTGTNCPSANTRIRNTVSGQLIDYFASNRSDIAVNALDGELYAITAPASGADASKAGVLCINVKVSPPVGCGFTPLTDNQTTTNYLGITDISKAGNRYFGVAVNNPTQLLCYDSVTNLRCENSPITLSTSSSQIGRTLVYGDQVYTKTDSKFFCHVVSSLATCSGTWPKFFTANASIYNDWDIVLHTDSSGNPDGVCTKEIGCMNFDGELQSWVNPYTVIPLGSYSMYSRGVTTLGRWYVTHYQPTNFPSKSVVSCFDFATNQACTGFTSLQTSLWYQVTVDPENPACLWLNSDPGYIRNFDAYTGGAGCTANPVVTLQPSQFAPRYACTTTNGIDQWLSIRLASLIGGGSASTISLTIRNPQGAAVANWTNRVINLNTPIDMSALDVLQTGSRPTFSFAFSGISGSITSAIVQLDYKGKGPELCSTVKTGTPASSTPAVVKGFLVDSGGQGLTYESRRNFIVGGTGVLTQQNNVSQTVPSVPRNLSGTGLNSEATLTFEPPTDNGGLELGSYNLSLDGGTSWTVVNNLVDNGDGTFSIPLTNLTPGTTYPIRLAATNILGRGPLAALSLSAQLVSLNSLSDTELSSGPIYMATQSSAALPYTYLVSPSSVCSVSNSVITLIAIGTCNVTQNQAGDANNIATSATASFLVIPDPVVATIPGVPRNLAGSPASGQVSLTWNAPSSDGGASVSDYIIQYKVGSNWVPFTDGVSTNTFTVVTGLTNGTSYEFKVASVNSVGQGLFTSAISSSPATVPGAPTNLSPNKSGTSATLTWTAPASNGGASISDYVVDFKLTSEATWTSFSDSVTATTGATVTGLNSSSSYDFRVRTKNLAGLSAPVSTVNLVATNGDSQAALSWSAPNTGGATITNYIVQYRIAGELAWTDINTNSTSTTRTVTGLANGQTYEVRVAAVVLDGNSNPIVSSYTSTIDIAPFTVPSATSVSVSPGNQQLILSWLAPSSNGSALTDYRIQYRVSGSATWITASDGVSTNLGYSIINLTNGTEYEVRVAAANSAGFGVYSSTATGIPRTVPGAISGLSLTPGPGSFTISWSPPSSDGGSPIIDYEIQYKLLTSTNWATFAHSPFTTTSHQIPDLLGLTRYSIRVAAVNAAGTGSFGSAGSEITLRIVHVVTWDSTTNGGASVSPSTQSYQAGDPALLAPEPATRSGYVFQGWFTQPSLGTKIADANSAIMPASTATYYAQWLQNTSSAPVVSEPIVKKPTVYTGPLFDTYSKRDPIAGEFLAIVGTRLGSINKVMIDGQECQILAHTDSRIELIVPAGVAVGIKDFDVTYGHGAKLYVMRAIEVISPKAPQINRQKLNLNAFSGKLSLYQRGYDGATLSWKFNGTWYRALATRWYQYWHIPTQAKGRSVTLTVFINGERMMSRNLVTK
ncbi:MAG: hypothetical protein RLZZ579_664 [Actinomycetota bacterium]